MRFQDPKIEKHGRKRLYYRIRPYVPVVTDEGTIDRQRREIRLGFTDEITLSEARGRKRDIMATLNGGPIVVQSQVKFSLLVEKYLAARLPALGVATREKYTSLIKNHIVPAFGTSRLMDIDKSSVDAWLISKSKLAKSTRHNLRGCLGVIFEAARNWKLYTGENPTKGAALGRGGPAREKVAVSAEEVRRFVSAVPESHVIDSVRARLIVFIAILAGLRVSEILGLQWRDLNGSAVSVRRRYRRGDVDEPKTAASARTREVGAIAEELRALRPSGSSDTDWIFTVGATPPDDRELQRNVWRPAAEAVGIYRAGFGLHTLRGVAVTWRQEEGATPIEAMRYAGHTRMSTTLLYTFTDKAREREVTNRVAKRLEAANLS